MEVIFDYPKVNWRYCAEAKNSRLEALRHNLHCTMEVKSSMKVFDNKIDIMEFPLVYVVFY